VGRPGGDGDAPTIVCVCAWCRRVRRSDGAWVAPDGADVPRGRRALSHGICEDCFARVRAADEGSLSPPAGGDGSP
jgi:hypothetical protein